MENFTETVLSRLTCEEGRTKTILTKLITHLHNFVRDVEPTEEEWFKAIDFLTRTGQMCTDKRQEFILFSDVLGVSMLVDAINHKDENTITETTVTGPFHAEAKQMSLGDNIANGPEWERGEPTIVSGTVSDASGKPLANAEIAVWQSDDIGFYDIQDAHQPEMNLRGVFKTDADGKFWFKTIKPAAYPVPTDGPVGELLRASGRHAMRPAHIHFMISAAGLSSDGVKTVAKSMKVLPKTVIYAPSLTADMPLPLAATSAMNAMAHLIEAVYAFDGNPMTYQTALMGIRTLKKGMDILIKDKSLHNANEKLQFGAYLAGKCLCEVSMALHHKMAHVLGGSFGMEHGKVHTVLLPYVLNFQYPPLSISIKKDLEKALNSKNPALKLRTLAKKMGAATTLKDIGFKETDIAKATNIILSLKKFPNPVEITKENVRDLLTRCSHGQL